MKGMTEVENSITVDSEMLGVYNSVARNISVFISFHFQTYDRTSSSVKCAIANTKSCESYNSSCSRDF